jgi:hypothetical protein
MPTNIRAIITVIVVLVTAAAFYFESQGGDGILKWIALALGAFMVYAMWLFPEVEKRSDSRK